MTFLQPLVLLGLPLILLPVLIHLLNRLRHRSQPWAAMRFLVTATRSSVSQAKLRQFLILLFRVLAVLMLVLLLSRPLMGGWLGWAAAGAPDAVLILLDRSASMETAAPNSQMSRRESALQSLVQAAEPYSEKSLLVLIENVGRKPWVLDNARQLTDLHLSQPTDTAADIPGMFQAAVDWLIENRAGTAEIWVASDRQTSNWAPDDPRWPTVRDQLGALPQTVRIRLLSFQPGSENNTLIRLDELVRLDDSTGSAIRFVVDLERNRPAPDPIAVTVNLDGARSGETLELEGQSVRWRHQRQPGQNQDGGWGAFEVPADANPRDNQSFFVYGPPARHRAAVVTEDADSARLLRMAAASWGQTRMEPAILLSPEEARVQSWNDLTLILWQTTLPQRETADKLRDFIVSGGRVIFFPPTQARAGDAFEGFAWSETERLTDPMTVAGWIEDEGPLARTEEGLALPLARLQILQRTAITGSIPILATYRDGRPLLGRQVLGRGAFYVCTSLPTPAWSNLGDGLVLVPMIQRLLQEGGRRLQPDPFAICGEMDVLDSRLSWEALEGGPDIALHAGVYRSENRFLAVNRPPREDDPEILEEAETESLFTGLPFSSFTESAGGDRSLQGEIWRLLLIGMLIFLLAEGWLILPNRNRPDDALESAAVKPATVSSPAS